MKPPVILWISTPLALLLFVVSLAGLLQPEIYSRETSIWLIQATTQDAVDLFLVSPFLMFTALYASQRNTSAFLLWGGIVSYLIYTFLIYTFSVHFNVLFIPYCLILGLSTFGFLYFLYILVKFPVVSGFADRRAVKVTTIYFFVISIFFYALWLADIIPSLKNGTIPTSIQEAGLFTNPVHVIDLSICLPGIFATALFLRKRNIIASQLAPAILTFFVFMDMTIGILIAVMHIKEIEQNLPGIIILSMLAFFSCLLLLWYMRSVELKTLS